MFHRLKLSRNNYLPYLRGLNSPISTGHGVMFLCGNVDCINPLWKKYNFFLSGSPWTKFCTHFFVLRCNNTAAIKQQPRIVSVTCLYTYFSAMLHFVATQFTVWMKHTNWKKNTKFALILITLMSWDEHAYDVSFLGFRLFFKSLSYNNWQFP